MHTAEDVFDYFVHEFTNLEKTPGNSVRPYRQDRMRKLLSHYGNPQDSFRSIHVAGSKGKGSTASYIHAALSHGGSKTGLYTSPHVSDFRERITVNRMPVPDMRIISNGQMLREDIELQKIPTLPERDNPTTFELLTLLAYLCFRDEGCEWAVIEVGIGGRLDTTNILSPVASVITPIELEHTEILGTDLHSVAGEKAGIIKPNTPVFVSRQKQDAMHVIADTAARQEARMTTIEEFYSDIQYEHGVLRLRRGNEEILNVALAMEGPHQGDNAALAFSVLHSLQNDYPACAEAVVFAQQAFSEVKLPGRFEKVSGSRTIILDAAHTPSSVTKVQETFVDKYGDQGILIFGSVTGKNSAEMAKILSPTFSKVIIAKPGTFKKSDPEGIFREFQLHHQNVELIVDATEAIRSALGQDSVFPILVCGSFYLIGEVRAALYAGASA